MIVKNNLKKVSVTLVDGWRCYFLFVFFRHLTYIIRTTRKEGVQGEMSGTGEIGSVGDASGMWVWLIRRGD